MTLGCLMKSVNSIPQLKRRIIDGKVIEYDYLEGVSPIMDDENEFYNESVKERYLEVIKQINNKIKKARKILPKFAKGFLLSSQVLNKNFVFINRLKEKGLPYISIFTDPTTGGVSASFAMIGDIHIAERGALIGFAGKRVIEQTIREKLPEGFQTAEYLKEHGMVDIVVERKDLKETVDRVLGLLMANFNVA
jgi:hypothetical protein